MEEIILYSSSCPKCVMIEKVLIEKGIEFTLVNDEDIYLPLAEENNIDSMPFASVNNEIMDVNKFQEYIKNRG